MNQYATIEADERPIDRLYKTEAEIAAIVGVGIDKWRQNARVLESKGLPKRDPLFDNRRYMPAVRAFLDRRAGLAAPLPRQKPDGREHWEAENGKQ